MIKIKRVFSSFKRYLGAKFNHLLSIKTPENKKALSVDTVTNAFVRPLKLRNGALGYPATII